MPTVVQEHNVPEAIRALSTMAPPDYVDLFIATLDEPIPASPEDLARAAIEGAAPAGRFLAWRFACRLRLEPGPSPDVIGGWRIDGRGDTWIRMAASSSFMTAHMVFALEPSRASFATFMRYDRPVASLVWGTVSHIHRAVSPGFLGSAVSRLRRQHGTASAPPRSRESG